jgi:diguanylate cyclase (GGDEF)-like protein
MASDVNKNLDRARRSLEKNKLRDAVLAYQAVLDESPANQEALQALADIYTRLNEPAQAARYYGTQFDRLLDAGDFLKATAVFTRFLKPFPQPADRLMRYATLLQKQNRIAEALEQFTNASEKFLEEHRNIEALACYESMALLDPENASRHAALGDLAERMRHSDLAARSFLRAGQLILASNAIDEALEYFGRACALQPKDRTGALLFAEAKLRKGDDAGAFALLEPFSGDESEKDSAFLALFGEALLRTNRLNQAEEIFLSYYRQRPENFGKLFDIVASRLKAGDDARAVETLGQAGALMRSARREPEFCSHLDHLAKEFPVSIPLAEAIAHSYEEMNRETKFFDSLVHLFDLDLAAGKVKEACDVLDRLVDIDPYDYRNQERIAQLEGKADPSFLQNIQSRAAKAATVSSRTDGFSGAGSEVSSAAGPVSEEARAQQALEDLIVQVEIFLQYALQSKAVERLERVAELFPGEEEKNERLRALYERAAWWPKGKPAKPAETAPAAPSPAATPSPSAPAAAAPADIHADAIRASAADTHRDLAAIADMNRIMYRQSTPREILSAGINAAAKHLDISRCLVVIGGTKEATQLRAQYAAPGMPTLSPEVMFAIVPMVHEVEPDALGGVDLQVHNVPELQELGLASALGVVLIDKETQHAAGALLAGSATPRKWKPNESFFLQAAGDQILLSVNHARLRSLVRSLAVADERTGLLNRAAYIDCLISETNRARAQNTPLSLIALHIDHGAELLRVHGDTAVDQYVAELARHLTSAIRQTDIAVKYTAWSLVFILPDTPLANAQTLAQKLREMVSTVRPNWGGDGVTVSAVVAEATARQQDDTEDRVTEWINRTETGLDEIRQNGGNLVLSLATP